MPGNFTAPVAEAGGQNVCPSSIKGSWVTANSDLRTAQTSAMILRPSTISGTAFKWVKVPDVCTRVLLRSSYSVDFSAVATSPVVCLLGVWCSKQTADALASDSTFPDDGTVQFGRLDNVDSNATGITLTVNVTAGTDQRQTLLAYSDLPNLTGYDILGCRFIGVAVQTAASVTSASNTINADLLFLN